MHKEKTEVEISTEKQAMNVLHPFSSLSFANFSLTQHQCKVAIHRDTVMQSLSAQHQLSPAV